MPPSRKHANISRGRAFSISRSTANSFGFSTARNASPKNAAFIAAAPASSPPPGWQWSVSRHRACCARLTGRRPSISNGKWVRPSLLRHAGACQAVGEPVRECPCRLQVVVLDVGRRDLDPEVALAVLTGPEVAQQRQQGAHLASLVAEVNAVGEDSAVLGAESADGLEVVFPVPAAADGGGERLAL